MNSHTITIFGSAKPEPGESEYETALALGGAIAGQGWSVCNGGYGGTMEATARGASLAGLHTIGVTCRALGRHGPNRYIREEIETDDLFTRLRTLIERGDGYVVLPGGTGTLLELALVWELTNKRLAQTRPPIVLLGDYWMPVSRLLAVETAVAPLVFVESVDGVIEHLRVALTMGR